MSAVRRVVAEETGLPLARTRPYSYGRVFSEFLEMPQFSAIALVSFAMFGLLLAAMGIFGVVSYNVGSRRREIGVRLALGATGGSVMSLVARETLLSASVGLLFGVLGAIGLTRVVKSLLYATSVTDPAVFALATAVLVMVAIAAAVLPARRAVRIDPVLALRAE
jgi:ABC-type antimicrobial peptide transport system permease subunit